VTAGEVPDQKAWVWGLHYSRFARLCKFLPPLSTGATSWVEKDVRMEIFIFSPILNVKNANKLVLITFPTFMRHGVHVFVKFTCLFNLCHITLLCVFTL